MPDPFVYTFPNTLTLFSSTEVAAVALGAWLPKRAEFHSLVPRFPRSRKGQVKRAILFIRPGEGKGAMPPTASAQESRLDLNYLISSSSSASPLGPSIMTARILPRLYGCLRNLTFARWSLATHASRFFTLSPI